MSITLLRFFPFFIAPPFDGAGPIAVLTRLPPPPALLSGSGPVRHRLPRTERRCQTPRPRGSVDDVDSHAPAGAGQRPHARLERGRVRVLDLLLRQLHQLGAGDLPDLVLVGDLAARGRLLADLQA